MSKIPVAAIFDIGKTNKKLFLFDEQYQIRHELQSVFPEIKDEDRVVQQAIEILEELTGNRDLCKQISTEAYQYAKNNFSRAEFNKRYRDLLMMPISVNP